MPMPEPKVKPVEFQCNLKIRPGRLSDQITVFQFVIKNIEAGQLLCQNSINHLQELVVLLKDIKEQAFQAHLNKAIEEAKLNG